MTYRRLALVLALTLWTSCAPGVARDESDCRSHDEAVYYANAYADHYNVPRELVHAIITQESGWHPNATSKKGAMGLMQLMPATAARLGVRDPYSISENIGGGVRFLADLLRQFDGDLRKVVAAYYCGSHPISKRGLSYSNREVLSYVVSVRRLYRAEITKHTVLQASIGEVHQ